ncbi:hypothetical protein [Pseudonocardia endophytica]|uniref:Uncharacterized protein n=1 Tax=Pseudonocardia endophytica TaxID=401976 RepID=A0A4R1HSK1_PSEEN|nr:hypothetical protein [Pseudonocardia endophytica]TCK20362.1 hypothetical protein EV378_4321 [Pseudonocardia endophytica]
MRASLNVALQFAALVVFAGLRLLSAGWLLVILIVTVVGLLVLAVPPVLSLVALRRKVLPDALTAPFVTCAGLLLLAGATMPDFGDVRSNLAIWSLIAGPDAPVPDVFGFVGTFATAGYLGSIIWLIIALARTGAGSRPPAPPVGPPYGYPAWPAAPLAQQGPVTPEPQAPPRPPAPGSAG